MTKDPAVLFYTSDFLTGTMTMSDAHVGMYIRLLCLQHQKGVLTKEDMLYICKAYAKDVFSKFIEKDGFYWNERMKKETERRQNYSDSRRNNAKSYHKGKEAYAKHMETENITDTDTINITNKEDKKAKTVPDFQPYIDKWNSLATHHKVNGLSDIRLKHLKERLKEKTFTDNFELICKKIAESDFLTGRAPSKDHQHFKATFDWVIKNDNNYVKILEGQYDNKPEEIGVRRFLK